MLQNDSITHRKAFKIGDLEILKGFG
jgi:hypothetical protein